jgi:hypothetical protein
MLLVVCSHFYAFGVGTVQQANMTDSNMVLDMLRDNLPKCEIPVTCKMVILSTCETCETLIREFGCDGRDGRDGRDLLLSVVPAPARGFLFTTTHENILYSIHDFTVVIVDGVEFARKVIEKVDAGHAASMLLFHNTLDEVTDLIRDVHRTLEVLDARDMPLKRTRYQTLNSPDMCTFIRIPRN